MYFSLKRFSNKVMYLYSWASSQAPVTNVVRLGINSHTIGSCMVSPTNYLEWVLHSRGNSYPNKKEKHSCTKWKFWVETPVLVWLMVEESQLTGLVALEYKELAPLKLKVL